MRGLYLTSKARGIRGRVEFDGLTGGDDPPPDELSLAAQERVVHDPYLEWTVVGPHEYEGSGYDVAASVTFTRQGSGGAYTVPMFYDGTNFRFRFTGPSTGTWDAVTSCASCTTLNGLTTQAVIISNPDEDAKGYLTSVVNTDGTGSFAYFRGDSGTPRRTLYNSWMRHSSMTNPPGLNNVGVVSSNASTRGTQIEALLDGMEAHGLQTHQILIAHNWVQFGLSSSSQTSVNTVPDANTFVVLEDWLARAHARGLFLHIWMWADNEAGGSVDNLTGGQNGYVDLRIQRMIAGRLAAFPNVTLSLGWDLEEWTTKAEVLTFHDNMTALSTLPRLYFARQSQERAPSPVFDLGADQLEVFSWDGYPTGAGSYGFHTDALNPQQSNPPPSGRPAGLPMMYEARFFINRNGVYTEENTRRLLWQFALANGTAAIIGTHASPYNVEYTYPERFKTITDFLEPRFHQPLNVVSTVGGVPVDGLAMANTSGSLQVLYKENASSIQVTIPAGLSGVPVVAQNCIAAHAEQGLGTYNAGTHTISLGSTSDWAVAVGAFGAPSEQVAPPEEGGIYVSLTGNDTTGDGTILNPYRSLTKAVDVVTAGQTIYLRGGTYDTPGTDVYYSEFGDNNAPDIDLRGKSTSALAPIIIRSYPGELAVFDGINHPNLPRSASDGHDVEWPCIMRVIGEYVTLSHVELKNSTGKGLVLIGHNNTVSHVESHHHHSDAAYVQGSFNTFEYYDGHHCYSIANGGNSGDAIKMLDYGTQAATLFGSGTRTSGNIIRYCRAWLNSDDGFDLWSAKDTLIEWSAAFNNGYGSSGNGQGWKLGCPDGGSCLNTGTVIRNSLSIRNKANGFTANGSPGVTIENCTSFNQRGEIGFDFRIVNGSQTGADGFNYATNNISVDATFNRSPASPPAGVVYSNNTWDLSITDAGWVSTDPTSGDFLALAAGSACRGVGVGGLDLGAIPYGQQFPLDLSMCDVSWDGSVPV